MALKNFGSVLVLALSVVVASSAWAQSDPSADRLIKMLDPAQSPATRGIHRVEPMSATSTPAIAAKAPPARETTSDAPSASLNVVFANNSAVLSPQAMGVLGELGKALSSPTLSAYKFRIEGHTDTVGKPDRNQALSERRAAAVAAYLHDKFGIDSSRLAPVGLGSNELLVKTPEQTAEPRNRRVQIVNIGA